MSFSFGFFDSADSSATESHNIVQKQSQLSATVGSVQRRKPPALFDDGGDIIYTPLTFGELKFNRVDVSEDDSAIDKDSDIIPGVYEGGNKIWECSVDLALWLVRMRAELPAPSTSSALELGCGHGLPGIVALQLGYHQVVFSDLNSEVLDGATWPNIYLNCREALPRAVCYSGDWDGLSMHLLTRYECFA